MPERRGIPHHVLDIWPVTVPASVAEYQRLARAAIDDILARGKVPLLVGGSGLYVRAVLEEFDFPGTDAALRPSLEEELAAVGALASARAAPGGRPGRGVPDPAHQRPPDRPRARSDHAHRASRSPPPSRPIRCRFIPLCRLGSMSKARPWTPGSPTAVSAMWSAGLVAETVGLVDAGLREGRTASRALGYQQVLAFLAGECTEQEAHDETIRATRRFVRRQRTWFRRDPRITWLDGADPALATAALRAVHAERAGAP